MAPVYSSTFALPTTNKIGAMAVMMHAYFSMTQNVVLDYRRVQLASDFGKRLRAAISCHLTQTSKESALLKINITSLTDVNKNTPADDKLLC